MLKLNVSKQTVDELFDTVHHIKFQESRRQHWKMNNEGWVKLNSVLWLFCWAYNGDGSTETAVDCEDIFNKIMPFTYDFFNANVGYTFAEKHRYHKTGDWPFELARILKEEINE